MKRANILTSGMMAMWFHGPARKTRLKTGIGHFLRAFHKWVGRLPSIVQVIGRRFWNVLKSLQMWSDSNSSLEHVWKIQSEHCQTNSEIGWILYVFSMVSPYFLLKEHDDEKSWAQRFWEISRQSARVMRCEAWWPCPALAGWPLRHLAGWGCPVINPPSGQSWYIVFQSFLVFSYTALPFQLFRSHPAWWTANNTQSLHPVTFGDRLTQKSS